MICCMYVVPGHWNSLVLDLCCWVIVFEPVGAIKMISTGIACVCYIVPFVVAFIRCTNGYEIVSGGCNICLFLSVIN